MSEKNEWKHIESAPKDELILVGPTKRMGICVAMNHSRDGWVTETCNEWHSIYTPTHWMPLPAEPCLTCNGHGMVGGLTPHSGYDAEPCPGCTPAPSAPGDAQDERAGGDVAYGIYRTRPDENGGKEFFYGAMWHDGTSLSKGERMVRGRFIPDGAPAAGDAPEDLLHRLANPLTPYGLLARALRVATGTTLMDMARATGNTAAEISSIEFGRKEPDEGWFERAALFFASTSYGIVVPPSALKAAHKRRAASQQQEG